MKALSIIASVIAAAITSYSAPLPTSDITCGPDGCPAPQEPRCQDLGCPDTFLLSGTKGHFTPCTTAECFCFVALPAALIFCAPDTDCEVLCRTPGTGSGSGNPTS